SSDWEGGIEDTACPEPDNVAGGVPQPTTPPLPVPHASAVPARDSAVVRSGGRRGLRPDMAGLCRVSNDLEVVVGWFSTAGDLSPPSILIHDFYTRQTPALRKNAAPCPIVLLVNCDLKLGPQGLSIQAMY
ncbi:unnamed protein product, partial [Cyprideis torosa]